MNSEITFCLKGSQVSLTAKGNHPERYSSSFLLLIAVSCMQELGRKIGVEKAWEQLKRALKAVMKK